MANSDLKLHHSEPEICASLRENESIKPLILKINPAVRAGCVLEMKNTTNQPGQERKQEAKLSL